MQDFIRRLSLGLALAGSWIAPSAAQEPPAAAPAPAEKPALRILRTGGLKVESAALLLSGQQGGPIPLAVLALPFPGGDERVRVPVVVEISGPGLLARLGDAAEPLLRLDVAVYALGDQGAIAGSLADTIEISLDRLEGELAKGGVRFWGEIAVQPGDYSLRVLVRRQGSSSDLGLRVVPLHVPAGAKGGTGTLLTPFVEAPAASPWLTVRASSGDPALTLASPLSLLAREGFPMARPIVAAPGETEIEIPAFGLPEGQTALTAQIQPEGQTAAAPTDVSVTLGERRATGIAGLTVAAARLTLPALSPGEYQIRLQRQDLASPPLALKVVGAGRVPTVWAAAAGGEAAEGAGGAANAPPRPGGRKSHLPRGEAAAFERSYRAALLRLAQGDAAGARSAVAELEGGLLRRGDGVEIDDLAEIEIHVLRGLGKSDIEALLPLLELYGEAYRQALAARDYLRTSHSRQLALALADFYTAQSSSAEGRQAVSRFLVGFAAELARGQEPGGFSTWAWKRTLEIDPTDEVALLCLAIDAEKRVDYREALGYLERLEASHPDSREGKIRLAIHLARTERDRRAQELLTALTAGPADWITALAYQTLGRLLLRGKKIPPAEAVLRAGREKFPDDEKLLLELASALDRQQKTGEARALLDSYQPRAAGDSPRLRYADWPEEALSRAVADFGRRALPRRANLAKALKAFAAKEDRR